MTAESAPGAPDGPLAIGARWTFLAGLLALALGTILAVLGVTLPGALLPGVVVLDLALLLLAAAGVLRVAGRD